MRVQSFRNRPLQRGSPTGSQALPENIHQCGLLSLRDHRSCQEPAPAQAFHGVTASFGCIHLLWCGVFHRLQVDTCSTVDIHGLHGDSLHHHGLLHRLQGNLCSGALNISPPSFFPDLGACSIVSLTYSHSSISVQVFVSCVIMESLPPLLLNLALPSTGSVLELAGTGCAGHRERF